mgnify:CR=1 FL=1
MVCMFPESPSNASASEEESEYVSIGETAVQIDQKVAKGKEFEIFDRKSTVFVKKADLEKLDDEESALEKLPVAEKEIDNRNKEEPG